MTQILDGKAISLAIEQELKELVAQRLEAGQKRPHLAAILVGDNPASRAYVGHKVKACGRVGFESSLLELPSSISQAELMDAVHTLNNNSEVDGFIVQLPLPDHIDDQSILEAVSPEKMWMASTPCMLETCRWDSSFVPATPKGIMSMLERSGIETEGKHAVILGRSSIVGTPMSLLLSRNASPGNCTVTVCHSRTQNLAHHTTQADILVAAIGRAHFVTAEMVKEGAVVIDVGINRIADETRASGHRLTGDVDFEAVAPRCSWITPVPGGVGPMTIASLMENPTGLRQKTHDTFIQP